MDRMADWPIFLHYSDENKKETLNTGGNNGHGQKALGVNRP